MARRATFPFGLPEFEIPSYGRRGGPLRYPRGRTGESEYDRETRLRQEMQMRLREQKFALPVQEEQMRLQNKMQAEGWELKYSTAVRAQVAQWNEALQRLNRDSNISPQEKEAMRQAIMQQMYGAEKTWTPPDPNKPRAPEGHEFGVPFMDDDGATYQYIIGSNGQVELKLMQRYDQGPEAKKMEMQRAWEEARGKLRIELMREEIEIREDGAGTERKRRRENWEIQELLNAAGYSSANAPLLGGAPQAPQSPPQPQVSMGLPPQARPAPARPPVVQPPQGQPSLFKPLPFHGGARAYIDRMKRKYPRIEDMPTDELRRLKEAHEALRNE